MEYPNLTPLTFASLKIIKQHLQEDPQYLERPECPYDDDIKSFFVFGGSKTAPNPEELNIASEINTLYQELVDFKDHLGVEDVAEQMSYFRTRTALIQKILELKERAAGLAEVATFQEIVLGILDDVMTPDQRTEINKRLKDYI